MKKRRKKFSMIASILTFILIASACGNATTQPSTNESAATESTSISAPTTEKPMKFAYVANMLSHEFYQRTIQGMQASCDSNGIELVIADSNSEVSTQVNNLELYAEQKDIDAILCSPIDPSALAGVVVVAKENGIPTITESNSVAGAVTMVGAKWLDNGQKMGTYAGEWLKAKKIDAHVLIVGFPAFADTKAVEAGFIEALNASGANVVDIISVDGQAFKEKSLQVTTDALTANPDINVIMGINDDSILGAIQAVKAAGLDPTEMLTMTHGLEGNSACTAMFEEKTLTAAYALFPEMYGQSMVKAGMAAKNGETLPELYESPMTMVDAENGSTYYTKEGDDYILNLEVAAALVK